MVVVDAEGDRVGLRDQSRCQQPSCLVGVCGHDVAVRIGLHLLADFGRGVGPQYCHAACVGPFQLRERRWHVFRNGRFVDTLISRNGGPNLFIASRQFVAFVMICLVISMVGGRCRRGA